MAIGIVIDYTIDYMVRVEEYKQTPQYLVAPRTHALRHGTQERPDMNSHAERGN